MKDISPQTHILTNCTNYYLPKARVLGKSIINVHLEIKFHLILSDILPTSITLENEPFDIIMLIESPI